MSTHIPDPDETPPPIFGSWGQFYAFVLILHALLIVAFYLFTQHYS